MRSGTGRLSRAWPRSLPINMMKSVPVAARVAGLRPARAVLLGAPYPPTAVNDAPLGARFKQVPEAQWLRTPLRAALLLATFPGCVGSAATGGLPTGDASSSVEASALPASSLDATATTTSDAAVADPDAPTPISWDGRVPTNHRASAAACPARGPGTQCSDASTPLPGLPCMQDSDCTAGINGRCFAVPGLVPPESGTGQGTLLCSTFCTYDQCLSDSDCSGHVPCACHFQTLAGNPNTCLPLSNCTVDSDCSPVAYCSFSGVASQSSPPYGYFCHTPRDLCIEDSDCTVTLPGGSAYCGYDLAAGYWTCREIPGKQ
jgi:hypothetical protein